MALDQETRQQLIETVRRFVNETCRPNEQLVSETNAIPDWIVEEMRALGFTVIGMHGWKALRGEQHRHRLRPAWLSGIVSALSHVLYTRRHPSQAAALLCVKSL